MILQHRSDDSLNDFLLALLVVVIRVQKIVVNETLDEREEFGLVAGVGELRGKCVEERVKIRAVEVEAELAVSMLVVLGRLQILVGHCEEGDAMT